MRENQIFESKNAKEERYNQERRDIIDQADEEIGEIRHSAQDRITGIEKRRDNQLEKYGRNESMIRREATVAIIGIQKVADMRIKEIEGRRNIQLDMLHQRYYPTTGPARSYVKAEKKSAPKNHSEINPGHVERAKRLDEPNATKEITAELNKVGKGLGWKPPESK